MDKEIIRVLHVVTQMNRNGLESRIMDIYRNIDRSQIQFDFLTHRTTEGHFDNEIRELGGKIYYFPAIRPHKIVQYLQSLVRFFQDHPEYKIVHAHLNAYCTWVLQAAKQAGVPVRIAHSRNSGMDHNWKAVFKYGSKLFVNIPTTHKFACSQQAGEWLFGKKGIMPPNKFKVIPNGFELEKFRYDPKVRESMRGTLDIGNELAFVHVGRLTYQKNHQFLLDVFEQILLLRPDSKLFLLGDGEERDKLEQRVIESGLSKKVFFLGNRKNVGEYLQAMDAMIFPSIYEGFGTVVIETQCIGLPTLSSDVLPKETKLTECQEFLSIKKDSAAVWAAKIIEMTEQIERKDRLSEIKKAGYDIKDTYTWLQNFYIENANN